MKENHHFSILSNGIDIADTYKHDLSKYFLNKDGKLYAHEGERATVIQPVVDDFEVLLSGNVRIEYLPILTFWNQKKQMWEEAQSNFLINVQNEVIKVEQSGEVIKEGIEANCAQFAGTYHEKPLYSDDIVQYERCGLNRIGIVTIDKGNQVYRICECEQSLFNQKEVICSTELVQLN